MQSLSGVEFKGRPLKIKPCVQKRSRPDQSEILNRRWLSTHPRASRKGTSESAGDVTTDNVLAPSRERRRVYVGNLPKPLNYYTSNLEVRDLFRDFEVEAVSKLLGPGREMGSDSRWYAFVDLRSADDATRAVNTLNGKRTWGRIVEVRRVGGAHRKALCQILDAPKDQGERTAEQVT